MSFGFGFGFPRRLTSGGGLSPSLYLDFVGTGVLPSTVTFSRGTNATLTDSNGRIAWAPHNLLTNSEDFEAAAWTKDRVNVASNNVVAPDGTTTADKVTDTAAGANTYRIYNSVTLVAQPYTMTVYAKAAEYSWCYLRIGNALRAWYNLANGTVGTVDAGLTASVSDAGNGWYRLTCTIATAAAGAGFGLVGLATGNGVESYTPTTGGMGIFIWGAQLNVANAPVNLLLQSENLTQTWTRNNSTATATVVTATATSNVSVDQAVSGTTPATRTFSARILKGRSFVLALSGTSSGIGAIFNGTTGAFVNPTSVGSVWALNSQSCITDPSDSNYWFASVTITNSAADGANTTATLAINNSFGTTWRTGWDAQVGNTLTGTSFQLNTGSVALPYVATTSSIYLPPAYNSTTPKNLLGFTQEPENAAWTKSNSYVQQNLLTWSQDFDNAAWVKTGAGTGSAPVVTANAATAPDGSQTAELVVFNRGAGNTGADQSILSQASIATTTSTNYAGSFYVKAATVSDIGKQLAFRHVGAASYLVITLTADWQRITRTEAAGGVSSSFDIANRGTFTADNTVSAHLWGAQLVQGSTAGDYTQTTSAAAPIRYLNWDGTLTGRKLVETTAASTDHRILQTVVLPAAPVVLSFYAKAAERNWVWLYANAGLQTAFVDISTGTIGTTFGSPTMSAVAVGGGWYRVSMVFNNTTLTSQNLQIWIATGNGTNTYTGDGTSGIFVSDFQLSNSASVDPYVYNPQAAAASAAYYGPRFDYNPTGTPVLSGTELVTNGDFTNGTTGWTAVNSTIGVSSGELQVTNTGAVFGYAFQSIPTVIGRTYRVSIGIRIGTASSAFINIGTTQGGIQNFQASASSSQTVTGFFTATATTTFISPLNNNTSNGFSFFDNVSVQEVTGYTATANGLLIEEQRTNLLTYSQDFSNVTAWPPTNITVTNAATTAPDGTNTAQSIAAATTAATLLVSATATVSATSATYSVYAKQGTGANSANTFILRNNTTATNLLAGTLNYSTGVFTYTIGSTGVSVQNAGNGWWRLIMTVTSGVTAGDGLRGYVGFSGASETAGTFLYAWGAQLEAGSFATSYIPTVASQVTRNADSASMLGDNFYTWYNPNQGTFTVQFDSLYSGSPSGSTPRQLALTPLAGASGYVSYWNNTVVSSFDGTNRSDATIGVSNWVGPHNIASAYGASTKVIYANGATLGSGAYAGTWASATGLTSTPAGHIRRIGYYNTRLPNATLQALTT